MRSRNRALAWFRAGSIVLVVSISAVASEGPSSPGAFDPARELETARRLLDGGDAVEAAERFSAVLERLPDDLDSIEGRIRALLFAGRWREALQEARGHAARLPGEIRVRSTLGDALFRAGRFEELDSIASSFGGRSDSPARAVLTLGRLRLAQGRESEAIELFSAAAAADPDDREVCYWASGATVDRDVALERLERYLRLSEGDHAERIESAKGSIRVYRALGDRRIWVPAERPERLEIPLVRLWDPGSARVTGFVVKARLGDKGKPVPLLLDSGSPGLFVIRRIARKRGFAPLTEAVAYGGGGDGEHDTRQGTFDSFEMGGLRFDDALASSAKLELDPTGRYHGVVGLSVFDGYRVTLDLKKDLLVLDARREVPGAVPYWTVGGQMLVRVELAAPDVTPFLFDTGATSTLVDLSLAQRTEGARLGDARRVVGFGGPLAGARIVRGLEVAFEGLTTGGADLTATDLSLRGRVGGAEIGGFLGLDLLEGARIVIDTVGRRIVLTPASDR